MGKKGAVIHEYDLNAGMCFLAKKDGGKGKVALFDSKEEAEKWVQTGEDIEEGLLEITYIQIPVE